MYQSLLCIIWSWNLIDSETWTVAFWHLNALTVTTHDLKAINVNKSYNLSGVKS